MEKLKQLVADLDLSRSMIIGLCDDGQVLIHCSSGLELQTPLSASIFVSEKGREKVHQIIETLSQALEAVETMRATGHRGCPLN